MGADVDMDQFNPEERLGRAQRVRGRRHCALVETVRATAVGRGAERDAERNAVLAGDPKCLVYYVMID